MTLYERIDEVLKHYDYCIVTTGKHDSDEIINCHYFWHCFRLSSWYNYLYCDGSIMKNSTEYLFGVPRSYFEPEITILAEKKIATATALKKQIAHEKNSASKDELTALAKRYMEADEAQRHWQKISEEK